MSSLRISVQHRVAISDEAKARTHFSVMFTLLCIGSWYHYIWLLTCVLALIINMFYPKWRCSPKKRIITCFAATNCVIAVSSTESKWPVQTNGSDLASHEQATYDHWHKNPWYLSTFPWRNAKIPDMPGKILTYGNPSSAGFTEFIFLRAVMKSWYVVDITNCSKIKSIAFYRKSIKL